MKGALDSLDLPLIKHSAKANQLLKATSSKHIGESTKLEKMFGKIIYWYSTDMSLLIYINIFIFFSVYKWTFKIVYLNLRKFNGRTHMVTYLILYKFHCLFVHTFKVQEYQW